MKKTVVELFAGVGGFRIAFNNVKLANGKTFEDDNFKFVWANQWEPSTKSQHAFDCYKRRFSSGNDDNEFSNLDISLVNKETIPDHTILCGGFPCQDYSVARSLSNEKGIEGKKGVLWWQIVEILKVKKPPFVLLENVDRLLKSPSKQRGRDFGIMLKCFADLDYSVEWRVINAADYGNAQRRRRTYIFAYSNWTKYANNAMQKDSKEIIERTGFFANCFPIQNLEKISKINFKEYQDLIKVSENFKFNFKNAGYMTKGKVYTAKYIPHYEEATPLRYIILKNVDKKYFLTDSQLEKFKYLRGAKKIIRKRPNGEPYYYSEGAMSPFDKLDLPGRTMLTSEGTVNRSSHIIMDPTVKKLRFLTPIECERLNGFPDDWTNTEMPEKRRYFMMGNALVTGVIKRMADKISAIINEE